MSKNVIPISLEVPVAGTRPPASPDVGHPESPLPFTGGAILVFAAFGIALMAGGGALRRVRKRPRRSEHRRVGVAVAALLALSVAGAASAADVTVSLTNATGSRTVYVENVTGSQLTSIDFGRSRSKPFRVRVVDSNMARTGFTVQASMGNLYRVAGDSYAWDEKIASQNLSLSYPGAALNVLDPAVVVAPVFDGTLSITAVCGVLGILPAACPASDIALDDLPGMVRDVTLPVDLNDLSKLPLVPQSGTPGPFTNPHYSGIGAGDTSPGTSTPTALNVLSGNTTNLSSLLSITQSRLQNQIDGMTQTQLVPQDTLVVAIKDGVKAALGAVLTDEAAVSLVDDVTLALESLTGANITGISGTYLSYPILDVIVPAQATGGDYRGTLIVSSIQS